MLNEGSRRVRFAYSGVTLFLAAVSLNRAGMFPREERNFTIIVYAVAVVVLRHRREFDGYETVVTTTLCVLSCSKRNATLQSAIGQRRIER